MTLLITLLVGVGLLWPLPVGGVVLMVAASFGLVIAWEPDLTPADEPAAHGRNVQ